MKTTGWDEIVFRDRNRNYGAYYLRRKYNKSVLLSFLGAMLIVSGLVGVPMVQAMKNKYHGDAPNRDVIITIDKLRNLIDPPPPTPPPTAPIDQIKKLIYFAPRIVDTSKLDLDLATTEEILESETNQPGTEKIEPGIVKMDEIPEDADKPFIDPSEHAIFMDGDLSYFHAWVLRNIIYPAEALNYDISGKVIVQFIIDKNGDLGDIKVLQSVDKLIDEETIRVLKMSPKWKPAKQGGTPVKQIFSMPVSFVLK
jgi:periplasmic protein TonB